MKQNLYKSTACLLLFICLISSSTLDAKSKSKKYYLCAAAVFCNEARFLPEWIEYHRLLGVEHFYLYNNLSTDDYLEKLSPYIKKGIVDLKEWDKPSANLQEWDPVQVAAYRDAIVRAREKTDWLAILDLDEFIVPVKDNSLKSFLKKYENDHLGGVCLMWSFFGTSHVDRIPSDKLMIESLIFHTGPACNGDVKSVWQQGSYKSIVRPGYASGISSPHYCKYFKGREHAMLPYDLIRINHYWTRDIDFLMNVKIPRREIWGVDRSTALSWAEGMNALSENNPILRFVEELREKMNLAKLSSSD